MIPLGRPVHRLPSLAENPSDGPVGEIAFQWSRWLKTVEALGRIH